MDICGKRILVTGGAKRCGAAMVRHFAAQGAAVLLHCNRSVAEAEALLRKLPGQGHRLLQADFSDLSNVPVLLEAAGCFDVLVNNASIFFRPGSAEDAAAENSYETINYLAPKRLMEYFAATAPAGGCAVNIVDQAVLTCADGAYVESRKKLAALTLAFAEKYGDSRLRFNAVAPGPVLPPSWAPDSRMEKTLPTLPLKRPVSVDDLVAAVDFLIKCESVTGAILPVDCGQSIKLRLAEKL